MGCCVGLGNLFITLAAVLLIMEIDLIPELNWFPNASAAYVFFLPILKPSLTFYFSDSLLTEPTLFKVWERRNQVREVRGQRKKRKSKNETVRKEVYFIAFDFLCLQVHALRENSAGSGFHLLMLIFSDFNWELMELLIHTKNKLKSMC